ncbi:MAG TPA: hypothetical protein VF244_01910 [Acidimicrobiales bacterium]
MPSHPDQQPPREAEKVLLILLGLLVAAVVLWTVLVSRHIGF